MNPLFCSLAFVLYFSTVFVFQCAESANNGCFRAAILDQVRQVNESSTPITIDLNLELYERAAKLAKQNGADIIVYPEDGIIWTEKDRNETLQFGEKIPSQKVAMCKPEFAQTHPVMHRLACMARNNGIFLHTNVIDIQPCLNRTTNGTKCLADGWYAFNTAVLFDRQGILLAKYHKIHLFPTETYKNMPPTEELVVVPTEIGRLGLHTCFDLLYKSPGHEIARRHLADTMLFSTSWYDEMPFISAVQFQSAWAFAHGVNMLAANIHYPVLGKIGSGIYVGSRSEFEAIRKVDNRTRLMLANLPVSSPSKARCPMNVTLLEVAQKAPNLDPTKPVFYFRMNLNMANVTKVKVEPVKKEKNIHICVEGVCCTLEYKMDKHSLQPEDQFYLIISNRYKPGPFQFYEEFCGLVHCPESFDACSTMRSDSPLKSKFHYVKLTGEFNINTTVYASVIGSQHEVMHQAGLWSYLKTNKLIDSHNGKGHEKHYQNGNDQDEDHDGDDALDCAVNDVECSSKHDKKHPKNKHNKAVPKVDNTKMVHVITVGDKGSHHKDSHPIGTVALYGRPYNRDPKFVHTPMEMFG